MEYQKETVNLYKIFSIASKAKSHHEVPQSSAET